METSVGVVLYRRQNLNNMFLLLKYPAGHWDFAKGHKEAGETNKQTALRELHEETGIKNIIFLKGFEKRIFYSYRHAGRLMRKQVIFFMGRTIEKDVRLSDEHTAYAWLDYQESLQRVTFNNAKRVLGSAHKFLKVRTR